MINRIYSYDDVLLENAWLDADENPYFQPFVSASLIERDGLPPTVGAHRRTGDTLILSVDADSSNQATHDALAKLFDTANRELRKLVGLGEDGIEKWYLYARPMICTRDGRVNKISLQVPDAVWYKEEVTTEAWNVSASGQTHKFFVGGNKAAKPVITATPKEAKNHGYAWKKHIITWNPSDKLMLRYYLDLSGQIGKQLDTEAIIQDSSQSNQINQVGGIAADEMSFPVDVPVGDGLPEGGGWCYVDDEQIKYDSIVGGLLTVAEGGRGWGGTTAATHADNAVLKYSRMLANGDDLRLFDHEQEVGRWLTGINTTTTGLHTILNYSPGITLELRDAIAGSGAVSEIQVKVSPEYQDAFERLTKANSKLLVIKTGSDIEVFAFESAEVGDDVMEYVISGITRAQRGTSAIAHSAGDAIYWMEHDLIMAYMGQGYDDNTSGPPADDADKPMVDLDDSTNLEPVWYEFFDESAARPLAWYLGPGSGANSGAYSASEGGTENPYGVAGLRIRAGWRYGHYVAENASQMWQVYHPAGFTAIAHAGKKYRLSEDWPEAMVKKSVDLGFWEDFEENGAPENIDEWEAYDDPETSLEGTYYGIRMSLEGSIGGPASLPDYLTRNEADWEIGTFVGTLNSNNIPVVIVGDEVANYALNAQIKNLTSDETIQITCAAAVDGDVVIDCENRTVTNDGVNALSALRRKDIWLSLQPGFNQISFTDVGTVDVDIEIAYRERYS